MPVLADRGYQGAARECPGVRVPQRSRRKDRSSGKFRPLSTNQRAVNLAHAQLRAPGERGAAVLKTRWKALNRIRLCPQRIGAIVAAALVLTTAERPIR